jgi:hypothetical protein
LLFGSPFRWWTKQQVTAGSGQVRLQRSLDNEPVQPLLRAISVKIVELAGTSQLKIFVMVNIKKFVAAGPLENDIRKPRCSPEVAKPLGTRLWTQQILDQVISANKRDGGMKVRAPGPGLKHQAASFKLQAFEPTCSSIKQQASSPEAQASSFKPQATSSVILDPRNMDIGEVLGEQGPRVFARINVLCG